MNFKKCSCHHCRRGLHKPKGFGKSVARTTRKRARRIVRDMIRQQRYDDIPVNISLPYTD